MKTVAAIGLILGSCTTVLANGSSFEAGTGEHEITVCARWLDEGIMNNCVPDIVGDSGHPAEYRLLDDKQVATALTIYDGTRAVTIVSVDVLYLPREDGYQAIVDDPEIKALDTTVIINASHGHASLNPDLPARLERIVTAIKSAIVQSHGNLQPAVIGYGEGFFFGSLNRVQRNVSANESKTPSHYIPGSQLAIDVWVDGHPNHDRLPKHKDDPLDKFVGVVHVRTPSGEPIATLFNYQSHPVIVQSGVGSGHGITSAGFPGYARRVIEKEIGGEALFIQGAAGDIVPYSHGARDANSTHAFLSLFSNALAGSVISAVNSISTYETSGGLRHVSGALDFTTPNAGKCLGQAGRLHYGVVAIGEAILLPYTEGEVFVKIGMTVKESLRLATGDRRLVLFSAYTNGAIAYIPPLEDEGTGGYGTTPDQWMCVEPGFGGRLTDGLVSAGLEVLAESGLEVLAE